MNPPSQAALALQKFVLDKIPMARAIDLRMAGHGDDCLAIDAPLAPNVNDKGCAFGGSLASVMTLAGWALVELALQARGIKCDVYVGQSDIAYLAPVWKDFQAEARLAEGEGWDTFFTTLQARSKARISVRCLVHEHGSEVTAATLGARFVAKRRSDCPVTTSSGDPSPLAAQ